jgi:hypothetical protein
MAHALISVFGAGVLAGSLFAQLKPESPSAAGAGLSPWAIRSTNICPTSRAGNAIKSRFATCSGTPPDYRTCFLKTLICAAPMRR